MWKQFQGTILALVALLGVVAAWWVLTRPDDAPKVAKVDKKPEGVELFIFEKNDLTRVVVERPDGTITLVERPSGWWIEASGDLPELPASRSMVNRVKHQLHDLVSRATVVEGGGEAALYGLGQSAINVTLSFRDGRTETFAAGDPNPSGVSFYIRRDDAIYTVKKSAVDYYSLELSEFRERRFASFDSKDVDAVNVTWDDGRRFAFQRIGDHDWNMLEPERFPASDDRVRGLMGRISALKAVSFVTDKPTDPELAMWGLDKPRLTVGLTFNGREPLTLLVGKDTGEKDGQYPLIWVKIADEPSVYTARGGLLEDYAKPAEEYRLLRFGRLDGNRISMVVATLNTDDPDDLDLNGTVTLRMAADSWLWDTGVPVPGSTPKRVAQRAAGISADSFVAPEPDDKKYGFDDPVVKVKLQDLDGAERTLVLGKKGEPRIDHEGNERDRYYARALDYPEVYLVDAGLLDVVMDLMREHKRKADGDDAKGERKDRIEAERALPQGPSDPRDPRNRRPPRPGVPSP